MSSNDLIITQNDSYHIIFDFYFYNIFKSVVWHCYILTHISINDCNLFNIGYYFFIITTACKRYGTEYKNKTQY